MDTDMEASRRGKHGYDDREGDRNKAGDGNLMRKRTAK